MFGVYAMGTDQRESQNRHDVVVEPDVEVSGVVLDNFTTSTNDECSFDLYVKTTAGILHYSASESCSDSVGAKLKKDDHVQITYSYSYREVSLHGRPVSANYPGYPEHLGSFTVKSVRREEVAR